MVPEGPSGGAASSAPESVGEESASPAVEAAQGAVDAAEAAAPFTNWVDISEEATALTVEPEDLIDLGKGYSHIAMAGLSHGLASPLEAMANCTCSELRRQSAGAVGLRLGS